jgi:hypothetical protein
MQRRYDGIKSALSPLIETMKLKINHLRFPSTLFFPEPVLLERVVPLLQQPRGPWLLHREDVTFEHCSRPPFDDDGNLSPELMQTIQESLKEPPVEVDPWFVFYTTFWYVRLVLSVIIVFFTS